MLLLFTLPLGLLATHPLGAVPIADTVHDDTIQAFALIAATAQTLYGTPSVGLAAALVTSASAGAMPGWAAMPS